MSPPNLPPRLWAQAALGLALLPTLACDPFQTQFDDIEPGIIYEAASLTDAPAPEDGLKVVTYNIEYGGARLDFFWICGGDRYNMTYSETEGNMEALAAAVRAMDPDILILQEADVWAKRSAYLDQVQYLLDNTDLNHGAYASQWKALFIPSDGIGPMDSGNAILSRWPVTDAERIALPLVTDYDALTQYFYLKRNVLRAKVAVPSQDDFWVVGTHTEAFSSDGTKQDHLRIFQETMQDLVDGGGTVVGAGDLNSLPPGSELWVDFPDTCEGGRFEGDDYTGEEDWLDPLYNAFNPAVEPALFAADNAPWMTFTQFTDVPLNRKLDYLFTNGTWAAGETVVFQEESQLGLATVPLSDHVPMMAVLEVTP